MAQRFDFKTMSHDDFAELGEAWAEERDARVKRLVNADKATRKLRNSNGTSEQAEVQ